ncbi:MAG: hypothetical protein J1E85_07985 [Ruminococcus sp.]|nr:hypothetical protein [Ruminococcus sp.]
MKKFTKALSVVLAVMMIMCTISALSFSASAAETTTTIYFAAPRGTGIANSWRNAQLYYGSTTTVGALKRIDMQRTGNVYAGDKGSLTSIVSDDWDVYSVTLTAAQISAIDNEKYVGFINANNRKTGLKNSILKATASGEYASTKSSIAAYNGKMFVINGCYDTSSELAQVTTYNVKVLSNNTGVAPAKSPVTLYFAAPLGTSTANTWRTASLFYGNDQKSISGNTKVEMTKTGDVYVGDKGKLTTLVSGNWDIYSVTLNAEQINRIDYAKYVGFVNGNSRKTGYLYPLQKATESGTYADVPKSIADYDGKMFIINGSYLGSEISSYTVKAVDYKVSEKYTVKATSNVGTTSSCQYSASNKQVTVTYTLQSSMLLENIQAVVSYDSKVLKLASTNSKKTISPGFYGTSGGGFEGNLNLSNMIKFNATNPDGYDFTKGQTVFTAVFDIVGSGDTTVDLDVYVLTATENEKDIKLVYRDEVINNNFTLTSKATV